MNDIKTWLIEPLTPEVRAALERLARCPDVKHVAVMPDVQLAHDVCIGTVLATTRLLYPGAGGRTCSPANPPPPRCSPNSTSTSPPIATARRATCRRRWLSIRCRTPRSKR